MTDYCKHNLPREECEECSPPPEQGDMFEPAYARTTDPDTSKAAAASMGEDRITALQLKALNALAGLGGTGINDEIVANSDEDWNTITPRMAPLERKGMVERMGKRPGTKSKMQTVWVITPKGRRALKTTPSVAI